MIRRLLGKITKQTVQKFNSDSITYRIGQFNCQLPKNHKLPIYQRNYTTYDTYYGEWIKIVAGNSNGEIKVLDIGANIGDTLLFILSFTKCEITAVEPSNYFFRYLINNVKMNNLQQYVTSHKLALVLSEENSSQIRLYNDGSTASTVVNRQPDFLYVEEVETTNLSEFLSVNEIKYDFVKIDIDSNDYMYVSRLIHDCHTTNAIICFEFDPLSLNSVDLNQAWELFKNLDKLEYSAIIIDNHGRTIMHTVLLADSLQSLTNWLSLQKESGIQHVHYFDIWIFPKSKTNHFLTIKKLNSNEE